MHQCVFPACHIIVVFYKMLVLGDIGQSIKESLCIFSYNCLWVYIFLNRHFNLKENRAPVSLEAVQSWSFNPWVHVFLVFCVAKWKGHIKLFCCRLKHIGCFKKKHFCNCLSCLLTQPAFSQNTIFTWKNSWHTEYGYSISGSCQAFSLKKVSLSLQDNRQHLSPMKKIQPLKKIRILEN